MDAVRIGEIERASEMKDSGPLPIEWWKATVKSLISALREEKRKNRELENEKTELMARLEE